MRRRPVVAEALLADLAATALAMPTVGAVSGGVSVAVAMAVLAVSIPALVRHRAPASAGQVEHPEKFDRSEAKPTRAERTRERDPGVRALDDRHP